MPTSTSHGDSYNLPYEGQTNSLRVVSERVDNAYYYGLRPATTLAGAADADADCGFEVGISDTVRGGMYWNQGSATLGFGPTRLAATYPLEISAAGVVAIAGGAAGPVGTQAAGGMTNGQTLTYANSPVAGYFILDAAMSDAETVNIAGTAGTSVNDVYVLSGTGQDYVAADGSGGRGFISAVIAGGFTFTLTADVAADTTIYWTLQRATAAADGVIA
jgi:hypothetical protein